MVFQISAELLDACILAILSKEDAYGYILTQNVKKVIDISESTLYPVLRRMLGNDYLSTYDMQYQSRNRKYYKITDSGKKKLSEYIQEWNRHKKEVDKILLGGEFVQ